MEKKFYLAKNCAWIKAHYAVFDRVGEGNPPEGKKHDSELPLNKKGGDWSCALSIGHASNLLFTDHVYRVKIFCFFSINES